MKVILIIFIVISGHGNRYKEYPMPNWQTCMEAVKIARVEVGPGNENEATAVVTCAYQ